MRIDRMMVVRQNCRDDDGEECLTGLFSFQCEGMFRAWLEELGIGHGTMQDGRLFIRTPFMEVGHPVFREYLHWVDGHEEPGYLVDPALFTLVRFLQRISGVVFSPLLTMEAIGVWRGGKALGVFDPHSSFETLYERWEECYLGHHPTPEAALLHLVHDSWQTPYDGDGIGDVWNTPEELLEVLGIKGRNGHYFHIPPQR